MLGAPAVAAVPWSDHGVLGTVAWAAFVPIALTMLVDRLLRVLPEDPPDNRR